MFDVHSINVCKDTNIGERFVKTKVLRVRYLLNKAQRKRF
jgi:hypothetical protein